MRGNNVGFIAILILLLATAAISLPMFLTEKSAHDRVDIRTFPMKLGEWKARDLNVTEQEYRMLETRNLVSREYVNPRGVRIALFIIYSETNRAVFHPPEVCMMGSGIGITDKSVENIAAGQNKFLTNKLSMAKDDYKGLALYSYKAGNLYTENFYLQQIYLIIHQVFGRQVPGATIRVSMQITGDEKKILAVLKSFLAETVKTLDQLTKNSK